MKKGGQGGFPTERETFWVRRSTLSPVFWGLFKTPSKRHTSVPPSISPDIAAYYVIISWTQYSTAHDLWRESDRVSIFLTLS